MSVADASGSFAAQKVSLMFVTIPRGNVSNLSGSAISHDVSRIALAVMGLTITAIGHAKAQPEESLKIKARIEAKATPDCIKAKFFLKNEGTEPVEIV